MNLSVINIPADTALTALQAEAKRHLSAYPSHARTSSDCLCEGVLPVQRCCTPGRTAQCPKILTCGALTGSLVCLRAS